jgi:hypothetical protein
MLGQHLATLPHAQAFREGIAFFNELKTREWASPLEELEFVLLHFIEQGTAPPVVRDLLSELPSIFGNEIPNFDHINTLIEGWLNHLELPPDARAQSLSKLDPDFATMIKALEQNLSPETKRHFGIAKTEPQ